MTSITNKNYQTIEKDKTFDELFLEIENALKDDNKKDMKHSNEFILRLIDTNINIDDIKNLLNENGYNVEIINME